ncbi:MAG: hypothetical protein A2X34_06415 [Elusimicrobia bacterium GWC2_51_8]|nr:MAG: hypothetical protein A2X33_08240 [Elusimicrobia bacterium GWA2_51_34]OGR61253.1 MAG: hypothetical protein A2X34_06415 [Elusimicrobia bacterium GWC2_51_8]OGR86008.1 MAG: hypothetical protein A2021_05320 [Elusimicrobia bacterium GWF2_52_66]HAF94493.1 hypothetical protein [Elusimicrobiota bacterium]HCE98948.1 hypothetical protein [Elusimicrobiota bacterium]
MKKIYELGAKTGLNACELDKITKIGALGIAALALASLAACFKSNKAVMEPAQPSAREQPKNLQGPVNSVNTSTAPARPSSDRGDGGQNCGPYPGYPCGTRYYTVSVSDFKT